MAALLLAWAAWPLCAEEAAAPGPQTDRIITLVIAGDTGFSGSMAGVRPDAGLRHGTPYPWRQLTDGIAAEINGDLNFANLETVVTERNDLVALERAFNFRSHPAGVRHLIGIGFNLLSLANNHSADFGEIGIRETLRHVGALEGHGLKAYVGFGIDREAALSPRLVTAKGARLAISGIGIGTGSHRAGEKRPGQPLYASSEDFAAVLAKLKEAKGSFRMLSVHFGEELQVVPSPADVRKLRDEAVRGAGVDLVIGHHAHVAAGVQEVDGRLIFYGLGNFLHLGMQDLSGFGVCRDYGLLARIYLAPGPDGRYRARAVEAVPLTAMHARTTRLAPQPSTTRIHVLNYLASRLDDAPAKARGIRFAPQIDGTGLYCAPGAAEDEGRIGALCRDWHEPPAAPEALARQIIASCGTSYVSAAKRQPAGEDKGKGKTQAWNPFGL